MHFGIVGGGFTGCLLAVHLMRRAAPGSEITIIENAEALGRGAAYGTPNPEHLLNVRAGNMGAFADDPHHFHTWLGAQGDASPASAFMSRRRYGDYVGDLLATTIAGAQGKIKFTRIAGTASDLHPGVTPAVSLSDERRLAFDRIALCFGNLPPGRLPGMTPAARGSAQYLEDPWKSDGFGSIASSDDVVIVGSGLTMADVIQSLAARDHRGKITVVSRHGLIPQRHEPARPMTLAKPGGRLIEIFRSIRTLAANAGTKGHDWRDVIDALRPHTIPLWRSFTLPERRQFLRHLRAHWDVHRHRLAPAVADTVQGARDEGRLSVLGGRVEAIDWAGGRFQVTVRPRGRSVPVQLEASWILNCTGPQGDYAQTANPLVRNAISSGALRADPLQLGLDVTETGAVIDRDGRVSSNVVALGPPTRGIFWEITSVPDLRRVCAEAAERLLA